MTYHRYYALAYAYRWYIAAAVAFLASIVVGYLLVRYIDRRGVSLPRPRSPVPAIIGGLERIGGLIVREEADEVDADPVVDAEPASQDSADVSDDEGGHGFDTKRLIPLGAVALFALPVAIFAAQGAWPFGPWRGFTIFGLPAYWTAFFGMLIVSLGILPFYVYFVSNIIGGKTTARILWIIAAMAQGGTIFDRARDGRYHARPLRQNKETERAEMYVDGEWIAIPGNIEYVSRLGWRPVAFTWEKTDETTKDVRATDMGEHPVTYLIERGMMDRQTAEDHQPTAGQAGTPLAYADGGGKGYEQYLYPNGGRAATGTPYNILDYIGHIFRGFNPYPDGGADDEYVIDTRKLMWKLTGSGQTNLLERAKDVALTDTARTTRVNQAVGYMLMFLSLFGGVAVAWLTV